MKLVDMDYEDRESMKTVGCHQFVGSNPTPDITKCARK